jgi:hypothetical protein
MKHPQPIVTPARKEQAPALWVGPLCFLLAVIILAAAIGLIAGYHLRK